MRDVLRVIVDGAEDGAWNMAVDETLLEGEASPTDWTLRFYGWRRPTVSLGYLQRWGDGFDVEAGRTTGVALVRRPTGGRAVLHADELTYSVAGPTESGPLSGGVLAAYRVIAGALCRGLQRLGVAAELARAPARADGPTGGACFASRSRYELLVDGRKLVGSAQRRRNGRLVQHGSMPLGRPDPRLWRALGPSGPAALRQTVGLASLLAEGPSRRRLVGVLAAEVAEALGLPARFGRLSVAERRRARNRLRRYASPAWTRRPDSG